MPVHDWTRVEAGIFHDFHHSWIEENKRAINRLLRGTDFYALAEQFAGANGPDILTLQRPLRGAKLARTNGNKGNGSVALANAPPKLRFHEDKSPLWYLNKKKAIAIRHVSDHRIVAILEIISPGNKASQRTLDAFVHKAEDLLWAGINLSVVDLFPPTKRDPKGIHALIWGNVPRSAFHFDRAKPLTCAAYIGGAVPGAFVEPIAVGDALPDLPIYVTPDEHVDVPLDATYTAAFNEVPDVWREVLVKAKR